MSKLLGIGIGIGFGIGVGIGGVSSTAEFIHAADDAPQPKLVTAGDAAPDSAAIVRLSVSPASVVLRGMNRQQQLLVTGFDRDGRPVDVTHHARIVPRDGSMVRVADGVVRGVVEGRTELSIEYGAARATASVEVTEFSTFPAIHFGNDVVPLLAKLNCNGGGCHGKQSGQNGFKLSVFGFDPAADHTAISKEGRGRRVFPAVPERSLFVLKATGQVPHGGGVRAEVGSPDAELLTRWIAQGMPWGDDRAPVVQSVTVEPAERQSRVGGDQQLLVTAIFSDGSRRDVTHAAAYSSNAETIASVDRAGRIRTGKTAGEAAVSINYLGHVATSRVIVPRSLGGREIAMPTPSRIDELVLARLRKLGLPPAELCDDATFLRRVYVHTLGMLPEPAEVREFLADRDPNKRRQWIDRTLERREYADAWALKWSDILLVDHDKIGARGAFELHRWLREQFAKNRPYDQWMRELMTASGNSSKQGPVNFYRAVRTPEDAAKAISQAVLGVRIDCAQCHHHPFEKWGQEDFYGLAGFFTSLERQELAPGRELLVANGLKPAKHPRTGLEVPIRPLDGPPLSLTLAVANTSASGKPAAGAPPGGATSPGASPAGATSASGVAATANVDPRTVLADWAVGPKNPYFARLAANRLWKHFLGRGLVEPEDDLRSTNPATNEPLLDHLADLLVARKYDLKAVMREIMNSRTYQLSSVPDESSADDEQNYSHHLVTRLPAEVLLDGVCQATGVPEEYPGVPSGTRAVQLWDNRLPSYFLETFGRSQRESPCECGKSGEPTMAQALHL
ncbi:MAG TPA: DUF1549 domain-containing protein, partial [Pirellulaceae bacterium]|nr:DUF1549 domain-containing protein [Pirellulaceae bacterium]